MKNLVIQISLCVLAGFYSCNMENPKSTSIINKDSSETANSLIQTSTPVDDTTKGGAEVDKSLEILNRGEVVGRFYDIVSGDYQHFIITDSSKKYHDFFIANRIDDSTLDEIQQMAKEGIVYVKVKWREVIMYVPESKQKDSIKQVYNIEILKENPF